MIDIHWCNEKHLNEKRLNMEWLAVEVIKVGEKNSVQKMKVRNSNWPFCSQSKNALENVSASGLTNFHFFGVTVTLLGAVGYLTAGILFWSLHDRSLLMKLSQFISTLGMTLIISGIRISYPFNWFIKNKLKGLPLSLWLIPVKKIVNKN